MEVLTSGVSLEGKELIQKAVNMAYGEGIVSIVDLEDSMLRQRVRLSSSNMSDVLVVLDGVSSDSCKDIENGLYKSEKYFLYTDDIKLVHFLNNKYGISIEIPEQHTMELAQETVNVDVLEAYENKLSEAKLVIQNLRARNIELENTIELGNYVKEDYSISGSEYTSLKEENLNLRDKVSSFENEIKLLDKNKSELEDRVKGLSDSIKDYKDKNESLSSRLNTTKEELTDYRVKYSTQSRLVQSKDSEIEELQSQIRDLSSDNTELGLLRTKCNSLNATVSELQQSYNLLEIDVKTKDEEIARLSRDLEDHPFTSFEQQQLVDEKNSLSEKCNTYAKDVTSLKNKLSDLQNKYDSLEKEKSKLDISNSKLLERVSQLSSNNNELENNLVQANEKNISLQGKVDILEASTDRNVDYENLLSKYTSLSQQYDSLNHSIFSRVSSKALPLCSLDIKDLIKTEDTYSKIRFTFAGSAESRKGLYKCLLSEFRGLPKSQKVVIVDVVSETSIDYVFEIDKVVKGIQWFINGGGIQSYLSSTCLSNVHVLSPGLGYINDSYFLTIDWASRLHELEMSGYFVVLVCGDISNMVGRILHENLADRGKSFIYVHGNATSSRAVVANLKGLSNSSKSIVCYYEYNKVVQRFYDLVSKTNDCRILST